MSKMSTEPKRYALNGPTMGTRWSALFYAAPNFDAGALQRDLQAAVEEIDALMSTWKPDSALMQLNAAPLERWLPVPRHLEAVLRLGLAVGRASQGAFDLGMGDAVAAWGFGPEGADAARIKAALAAPRQAAHAVLTLEPGRLRKSAPITLDLNGIAKGYGVDRLAEVLRAHGQTAGLVGIDGEMRALGLRPDGQPWSLAVEAPDASCRRAHSILALEDAAVATSGDYRHWVELQGRRLSHTMDPSRGAPLLAAPATVPPASVTVVASSCAEADAWATVGMVLGPEKTQALAERSGLSMLFLMRDASGAVRSQGFGPLFAEARAPQTGVTQLAA
jgi:thiamine biosynthesis lipoprotein